ncbi:O-linked N-acetylglucosamine transferase, SPINDLY family protein [Allorhizobium taibaishanense]|nr:tetratricopeptide repeat protein [Allorhizobium taibaishanense]MBB4010369.1 putative O-linked N-acetylglucosamine transferase (SPINDLY family) [Allorhizobium taibaishanense]
MLNAALDLQQARSLFDRGDFQAALESVSALVGSHPGPEAASLLAEVLLNLGAVDGAVEAFEFAAKRMQEQEASATRARAASLALMSATSYPQDRLDGFLAALVASDRPEHWQQAGEILSGDTRNPLTLTVLQKLRQWQPQDNAIRMLLLRTAREQCHYPVLAAEEPALRAELAQGGTACLTHEPPHASLMWEPDEALNRLASLVPGFSLTPAMPALRRRQPHIWGDKIRIGYLSCDLWDDHATMRLLRTVIASHDPGRFEITLFCYTPEQFLAFDHGGRNEWGTIVSITEMTDNEAAAAIKARGIDILVDIKGHTRGTRSQLMNRPLAPIHVQWLGFPGTCIEIDCDYVIGDRFVLPEISKPHYHEKFCRLPECYQPNDPVHRPLPEPASRLALGLPSDRVVIGAFNSQRKNSLETMALWAEILKANPKALLWLMVDGNGARQATSAHFKSLGVKQSQLLFAPKMAYAGHLARVQAADFAIDTFPCNGHTTTSDMLWAGLPVLTKRGSNFASRVSESLLNAIGLPELVAQDDKALIDLVTGLVNDPLKVKSLKQHLADQRFKAPLFNSKRFCRHLEAAYTMMAARARAGLEPDHFDVPLAPKGIPA